MPKPMTKYKVSEAPQEPEHSFKQTRRGEAYAHFGKIKTYANKTQADNARAKLSLLGYKCFVSFDWPFTILKDNS